MGKLRVQHFCYPVDNESCSTVVWLVPPSAPFSREETEIWMYCSAQYIRPEPRSRILNKEALLVSLCTGFPVLCNNSLTSLSINVLKLTFFNGELTNVFKLCHNEG